MADAVLTRIQAILGHLHGSAAHEPVIRTDSGRHVFRNWARIVQCEPKQYHEPETETELVRILQRAAARGERVKVIGTGHSPNDIACTADHLVSLKHFNRVFECQPGDTTVRVQGGALLTDVNRHLASVGMRLPNQSSISEQTVAGAIATCTHGTGISVGSLPCDVVQMRLLTVSGENIVCSERENPDIFRSAQCHLGLLGVVMEVTFRIEPNTYIFTRQYQLPFDVCLATLPTLVRSGKHTRLWWFPYTDRVVVWHADTTAVPIPAPSRPPDRSTTTTTAQAAPEPDVLFDSRRHVRPLPSVAQLHQRALAHLADPTRRAARWDRTVRGRWIGFHLLQLLLFVSRFVPSLLPLLSAVYVRLLHGARVAAGDSQRMLNFDVLFSQYVNEWSIPVERTAEALWALHQLVAEHRVPAHFPVEIRFVRGDNIPLSPCYGRDSCMLGLIMYRPFGRDPPGYQRYFALMEAAMLPLEGRPHWAKAFSLHGAALRQRYPEWDVFAAVRRRLDPQRVLWNAWAQRVLGDSMD